MNTFYEGQTYEKSNLFKNIKWNQGIPKEHRKYLCKIVEFGITTVRQMYWDYIWGWCAEIDDFDRPHFVYSGTVDWAPIPEKYKYMDNIYIFGEFKEDLWDWEDDQDDDDKDDYEWGP